MKSLFLVFSLVAGGIALDLLSADTGWEGAVRKEVGSYPETRFVTLSATEDTLIASASKSRPDLTCMNNTAYTIYIGSNAAGATLLNFGFPILSSATFNLGAMTGEVYALLHTGGAGDVRCFDGLVR